MTFCTPEYGRAVEPLLCVQIDAISHIKFLFAEFIWFDNNKS